MKELYDDITISSFSLSADELKTLAAAAAVAKLMLSRNGNSFVPVVAINEYDSFYGNSVTVEFKKYISN